ncbi:hypothetical protein [Sphingomonas prati]|uniref:Uncharacterized protein n=1 Tax=Sphingomonas prati TaxID=1843237 RepID=A0A7W9F0F3_9SPHN|nr:hypothetical protein [Sphingomonas prati]MBB5728281.1 hypothetical protein [Sphingomonas prati]
MEHVKIVPPDPNETEEDRLREKHLRAFVACMERGRLDKLPDYRILTPQPPLPRGLGLLNLVKNMD